MENPDRVNILSIARGSGVLPDKCQCNREYLCLDCVW